MEKVFIISRIESIDHLISKYNHGFIICVHYVAKMTWKIVSSCSVYFLSFDLFTFRCRREHRHLCCLCRRNFTARSLNHYSWTRFHRPSSSLLRYSDLRKGSQNDGLSRTIRKSSQPTCFYDLSKQKHN